jgi:PAS domain S-box-containing protein
MTQTEGNRHPLSVLLVEDEPVVAEVTTKMLQLDPARPVAIETVNSLGAALALVRGFTFDVVFLDLTLPDSTGLGTFERLHAELPDTPVVVVTGLGDHELARACMTRGAQDYLVKGRSQTALVGAAYNALERFQLSRQARASAARAERLNGVLRSLYEISQLVFHETEPNDLVRHTADLLVQTRGYAGAWVALRDGDGARPIAATAGAYAESSEFASNLARGLWPDCYSRALGSETGLALTAPADPCAGCALRQAHRGQGTAVVLLRHEGTTRGALGVSTDGPSGPDPEECALLLRVAGDIAFAVHSAAVDRLRQRSEAQRDRYARIVRESMDAMALVGPDSRFLEVNPAYQRLVGLPASDIVGRSMLDVAAGASFADAAASHLNRCFTGDEVCFETWVELAGRPRQFVQASYAPCREPDGSVSAAAVCLRDLTALHAAQVSLRESEERYRDLLENLADAVYVLDAELRFVYVSPAIARLAGYAPAAVEGKDAAVFVHPDDRDRFLSDMRTALLGQERRAECRALSSSGTYRWVSATARPVLENGRVVGVSGTIRDVHERKSAEEALRRSEWELSQTLDATADGIWKHDLVTNAYHLSPRYYTMLGYVPDEFAASLQTWKDLLHPDDVARAEARVEAYRQAATDQYESEFRLRSKEGAYRWIHSRARVAERDVEGRAQLMIGADQDITEQRLLQLSLAQSDRLASMGLLAAGVAHEINNPLAYIVYNLESSVEDLSGLCAALSRPARTPPDGPDTLGGRSGLGLPEPAAFEDVMGRLREALGGAHRIRDIARGLGTFSRIEQDERRPVDLKYAIECAVNMAYNEIKYRARLVKDYGKLPPIMASDGRLSQVFLNLLINAAHAIPEGDIENHRIGIRTWVEGDWACAEVRDTGEGIASEQLDRIFEPFFTTKHEGMGSGLGLTICRKIVTDYGGEISASSELGSGTRFRVRFPIPRDEPLPATGQPQQAPSPQAQGGRLLVVDDEQGIRSALKRLLGKQHEVVLVESGEAAVDLLERDQAFDLVLCDMMMPRMSGMAVHEWLVGHVPKLAAHFVFLTGGAFTPKAREYIHRAGSLRVEKPFDAASLKTLVGELVRASRNRPAEQ